MYSRNFCILISEILLEILNKSNDEKKITIYLYDIFRGKVSDMIYSGPPVSMLYYPSPKAETNVLNVNEYAIIK